jgi:hypothetical protein
MSMDSIMVVNESIAALRPHLPGLQLPSARALHDVIGAALHRQGKAHLLHDVAGNESEIKRALRQAVRDEPQFGSLLGQASTAARSAAPPSSIPPTAEPPGHAPPPVPSAPQVASVPPPVPSAPAAVQPAQPVGPAVTLRRPDFAAAVDATPGAMRHQIFSAAGRCAELVDAHLPEDEEVLAASIASARRNGVEDCLLVLTDRRLIFVAPRPQVVAYRLAALTRSQAGSGYFFLEGDAGEYSVGLPDGPWSKEFEQRVFEASALAVLSGR